MNRSEATATPPWLTLFAATSIPFGVSATSRFVPRPMNCGPPLFASAAGSNASGIENGREATPSALCRVAAHFLVLASRAQNALRRASENREFTSKRTALAPRESAHTHIQYRFAIV